MTCLAPSAKEEQRRGDDSPSKTYWCWRYMRVDGIVEERHTPNSNALRWRMSFFLNTNSTVIGYRLSQPASRGIFALKISEIFCWKKNRITIHILHKKNLRRACKTEVNDTQELNSFIYLCIRAPDVPLPSTTKV